MAMVFQDSGRHHVRDWRVFMRLLCLLLLSVLAFAPSAFAAEGESAASGESAVATDASEPGILGKLLHMDVEGLDWNPAVLAEARATNPDVYAWLYVPGTNVNHPVLQGGGDEDFYLTHDIYGNGSATGELYSQYTYNTPTFADPVTVVYGHTFEEYSGLGEEMFSTLHNFEDQAFFDSHPNLYVFVPGAVLKYRIVSAYVYPNLHVLDGRDFNVKGVAQSYFDFVANPDSPTKSVRPGVSLVAGKNHILQLATCTRPANDDFRYLVTGVLVDGRPL